MPYGIQMNAINDLDLDKIRTLAKGSRLKTRQLAEAIGVAPDTMRKFLSGATKLRKPSLMLLAQTLKVNLEALNKNAS